MSKMTVEEKVKKLCEFCDVHDCWNDNCPLLDTPCNFSEGDNYTEEDINTMYNLAFPNDPVNHPSHYTNGMECIDEMILVFGELTVANFCLCNVWKYRKRALHKNGEEDLKKADWYMNKYKELIEKRHIGVEEYVREH